MTDDAEEAPARPFEIELPTVERIDGAIPIPDRALGALAPDSDDTPGPAEAAESGPEAGTPAPPPSRSRRAPLPPLPSWGIALVGGLSLVCLALTAALAIAATDRPRVEAAPAPADTDETAPAGADAPAPVPPPTAPATPADFSAEPAPIPVDLLTRLESASDEPLDVELSRLLDAIHHGFGRRSAQLEPTLRSYVYRMASRFEWNPDTFRVAVTAPDPDLASARAVLLEHLFEDAVAAGRLDVGVGVGPHALTLVTE
ncbi:hypothetical protein [Rubrivirga marina]|uniref:hypothetical protein n=1 Tax=Rubrivirga marina TaxID=1196024 RepID=UPI00117B80C6|nr:hypothetical protein [Rubrivirga marina]